MSKQHLLTIITKLELGGAQQVALNTLRLLPKDQYRCFLISGQGGLLDQEARQLENVEVHLWRGLKHPIRPWADVVTLIKLMQFMRRHHITIVHTHSSKAGMLGRWAARLAGVPKIIHTIHGWPFHEQQPLWLRQGYIWLERLSAKVTHRLIAVSQATKSKGLRYKIGRPLQYQVIWPGSDLKTFGPGIVDDHMALREQLHISGYPPVVGMIANMKPQKAPVDFVRMAALVHEQLPEVRFLLVGDGPLRPKVEAAIARLSLEQVVLLTGWRQDVPELMRGLNLVVLTSLWEGLPCVFGQAMKTGLPIVATDVEGARDAITDGETGFLVPIQNPRAMAEKVVLILKDQSLRIRLGRAGMKQAQRFGLEAMLEKVMEIYARPF